MKKPAKKITKKATKKVTKSVKKKIVAEKKPKKVIKKITKKTVKNVAKKQLKGIVTWFNVAKGFGELKGSDNNSYYLFGGSIGGDMYGQNIPKNRTPKQGDEYKILKTSKKPTMLFQNSDGEIAVKVLKIAKRKPKKVAETKAETKSTERELNQDVIKSMHEMSRGFPDEIARNITKYGEIFIHKYPNLDIVLQGGDLIARPVFHDLVLSEDESWIVGLVLKINDLEAKALAKLKKEDDRIFIGAIHIQGVACGYIEAVEGNLVYVTGMGNRLES